MSLPHPLIRMLLGLCLLLVPFVAAVAQEEPLPVDDAFRPAITQDDNGTLSIDWKIAPGYYLYRDRFSLIAGIPPRPVTRLHWSPGRLHQDAQFGQVTVFYDRARLRLPTDLASQSRTVRITYQGCQEGSVCYPPTTRELTLPAPRASSSTAATDNALWHWAALLAMAFAGGALLNLMPCVLPVLSLKVLTVLEGGDASKAQSRALAYSAGALLAFATLGMVAVAVRMGGAAAGWGFQMQNPVVVALLAMVMAALGLGFSGVVHYGVGLAGVGAAQTAHSGLRGEFFSGVLACVVASPCTAPLMGAAMAHALLTANAASALLVFLALGLGLASPVLLLAFVPWTRRWLPRPGAWMETLRQWLAYPLYATSLWLLWVLGRQLGVDAMALALLAVLVLSMGLWWREKQRFGTRLQRMFGLTLVVLSLLPVLVLRWQPPASGAAGDATAALPAGAERFTQRRLAELRGQGRPVFVDVTADWCLTCKVNQSAVLDRPEFHALLARSGTTYLVADYTAPNQEVATFLAEHHSAGLPLYVIYRNGRAEKLPVLLSLERLRQALGAVGG